MTNSANMIQLLDAIRDHLSAHQLPAEIASVEVGSNGILGEQVIVHLRPVELPALASALLDWADTLTAITVTAWRPPQGQSVHLTLSGRLPDKAPVEVYSGVGYSDALFGDLQPGGRQGVALSIVRSWAAGNSVVAA